MGRRAELVDETRLRITEAAVRLHTTVGPANTSIASIAEEAGVTRLTVYRHFADLDAVFAACTAHWDAQNPRPDTAAWRSIPDLESRARRAFETIYGWHRDHAAEMSPIYRDVAAIPDAARQALAADDDAMASSIVGVDPDRVAGHDRLVRAFARHLVGFVTWRSLVVEQGLDQSEAVELAVRALTSAAASPDPGSLRTGAPRRRHP
jgi:AcrR family transcriptional regulator